jgi:hypothetical protein
MLKIKALCMFFISGMKNMATKTDSHPATYAFPDKPKMMRRNEVFAKSRCAHTRLRPLTSS